MIHVVLAVAALLVSVAGATISARGQERARAGERQALEVSALEYQLTHGPQHVIVAAMTAYAIAESGRRLARLGHRLAAGGLVAQVVIALVAILT